MRLILLAAALFGLALSHAQPLLRLFGQDIEVGLEHQRSPEQAVPDARGSRAAAYEQLVEHVVRKEGTGSSGPASSHVDVIRFSHSPSSPFQPVFPASEARRVAPSQHPGTPGSASSTVLLPQIDLDFSNLRNIPHHESWLELPKEMIQLHVPWFANIYNRMISTLPNYKETIVPELEFSEDEMAQYQAKVVSLLVQGNTYKLPIPTEWLHEAGIYAPAEVLGRYHTKFTFRERTVYDFVSFWSTADAGSKLALLGVFQMSRTTWETLKMHYPGAQRIDVYYST